VKDRERERNQLWFSTFVVSYGSFVFNSTCFLDHTVTMKKRKKESGLAAWGKMEKIAKKYI
jgi:hypothetical protein